MAKIGAAIKSISPALSAIPYVGGILSALGTGIGGALEVGEAKKQAEQAERIRKEALATKPQKIQDEYLKDLRMKTMAAATGLPGLEQAQTAFESQSAKTARAIRESSPSGAATLAAMSAAKGLENSSIQELMGKNAQFKADALYTLGETVKGIGGEKQSLQNSANVIRKEGLQAASAFDAAATYNKQNAINKILATLGSTAATLTKNADGTTNDAMLKKLLAEYMAKNGMTDTAEADSGLKIDPNDIWNYQPNITPDYTTAPQ